MRTAAESSDCYPTDAAQQPVFVEHYVEVKLCVKARQLSQLERTETLKRPFEPQEDTLILAGTKYGPGEALHLPRPRATVVVGSCLR